MQIKLNADVGEGMLKDPFLMPYLSYANVACGGHFGNAKTVKQTITLAKEYNVKVGAHPSYPDKINFGRKSIALSIESIEMTLKEQIGLFESIAELENIKMHHVKLHGALYNDVFKDAIKTKWFLNWMNSNYKETKVFVPIGAKVFVENYFLDKVIFEAFADRNYDDDMQLISRAKYNASIENEEVALTHVSKLFLENKLVTVNTKVFDVQVDTYCLHGDNPNVLAIVKTIATLTK